MASLTSLWLISFQLSQLIVNAGGVAAVIDCIGSCKGNVRLPGIMMLGYVAAHSENLAMAVIISKVRSFPLQLHCLRIGLYKHTELYGGQGTKWPLKLIILNKWVSGLWARLNERQMWGLALLCSPVLKLLLLWKQDLVCLWHALQAKFIHPIVFPQTELVVKSQFSNPGLWANSSLLGSNNRKLW